MLQKIYILLVKTIPFLVQQNVGLVLQSAQTKIRTIGTITNTKWERGARRSQEPWLAMTDSTT